MITQLTGALIETHPSHVVIDCHGVGYWVSISLNTFTEIEKLDQTTLYTYHLVREDAQALYGFANKEEREIFQKLISVSGVGPASAIMMLSTLSSVEIFSAISNADVKTLQSVKGIGAKTAQRIIIDLKDKLAAISDDLKISTLSENKVKLEALSALEVLGISKKMAEKHVQKMLESSPNLSLEEVIKETLKKL